MPKVIEEWVTALRSGKFVQGTGALKQIRKDGQVCHCVIGVLAEINGIRTVGAFGHYWLTTIEVTHLGLSSISQRVLTELNDKKVLTFDQLANLIEENRNDYIWRA